MAIEPDTPEAPYLFVYGTLRAGAGTKWSRFLAAASRFAGAGRCRGALFQLNGYPGMSILTDDDAWVRGEVYLLTHPLSALAELDAYEGCGAGDPRPHEFERRLVTVLLDDGRTLQAWAYVYGLDTEGKRRIASGDYLQPEA